jgi:hypothetical protein
MATPFLFMRIENPKGKRMRKMAMQTKMSIPNRILPIVPPFSTIHLMPYTAIGMRIVQQLIMPATLIVFLT